MIKHITNSNKTPGLKNLCLNCGKPTERRFCSGKCKFEYEPQISMEELSRAGMIGGWLADYEYQHAWLKFGVPTGKHCKFCQKPGSRHPYCSTECKRQYEDIPIVERFIADKGHLLTSNEIKLLRESETITEKQREIAYRKYGATI